MSKCLRFATELRSWNENIIKITRTRENILALFRSHTPSVLIRDWNDSNSLHNDFLPSMRFQSSHHRWSSSWIFQVSCPSDSVTVLVVGSSYFIAYGVQIQSQNEIVFTIAVHVQTKFIRFLLPPFLTFCSWFTRFICVCQLLNFIVAWFYRTVFILCLSCAFDTEWSRWMKRGVCTCRAGGKVRVRCAFRI